MAGGGKPQIHRHTNLKTTDCKMYMYRDMGVDWKSFEKRAVRCTNDVRLQGEVRARSIAVMKKDSKTDETKSVPRGRSEHLRRQLEANLKKKGSDKPSCRFLCGA